jgi:hypothetical protein
MGPKANAARRPLERLRGVPSPPPEWKNVLAQLAGAMPQPAAVAYPERIASRLGERAYSCWKSRASRTSSRATN